MNEAPRHILSLSGGKDSTALAIHMRGRIPEMEYIFCDTGEELSETYEYIDKLEAYLDRPIIRLNPERPFAHYLELYRGVLPDPRTRWCTRMLKIKPFEKYVGDGLVYSYIGIRADENRSGYISKKENIIPVYPFKDDGIDRAGVERILLESGLGLPDYYRWRSRSGCYFCFFQQRQEWANLSEEHPDLFEKAKSFEKFDPETGERFTWVSRESLEELQRPERIEQIRVEAEERSARRGFRPLKLVEAFAMEDDGDDSCLVCHL
ncbi:MAG: phosphoadenosine phosphosulfate reductase family protein [Fimbriimonas sp.]